MPKNTYVALDKTTITSATPSITFTGISGAYTDLVLVATNVVASASFPNIQLRFNGDTGANYGATTLEGNGTSVFGKRKTSVTLISDGDQVSLGGSTPSTFIYNIMNYANTTTYKTVLLRANQSTGGTYDGVSAVVGTWRKTPEAITSLTLTLGDFASGATFALYGIKAWVDETTPKATGGYVTSDSTYWYHAFPYSGTFTPVSSISSCEYVVVAGGGGGGGSRGGGGGAGGYRTGTATISSALAVTVGAGGLNGTAGGLRYSGSNSSFNSLVSTGGGGGGGGGGASLTGGSGGGGHYEVTAGAAGNAGAFSPVEGYAGANAAGLTFGSFGAGASGGGGGAGGVAPALTSSTVGGNGGVGSTAHSSWLSVVGFGVNGYLAGGGGGAVLDGGVNAGEGGLGGGGNASTTANTSGQSGVAATGSGGGAGYGGSGGIGDASGGAGGSGLVLIRYPKA